LQEQAVVNTFSFRVLFSLSYNVSKCNQLYKSAKGKTAVSAPLRHWPFSRQSWRSCLAPQFFVLLFFPSKMFFIRIYSLKRGDA
jgi:hypothetical protein